MDASRTVGASFKTKEVFVSKKPAIVICAVAAALLTLQAEARGGGAGGGAGGPPLSSRADENSNGRFATDRDKGLDRAEDRKSAQALKHEAHKRKPRAPKDEK